MTSTGLILLYIGIVFIVISTILTICFKQSIITIFLLWSITLGFLISGITLDLTSKDGYCAQRNYKQIFKFPMNFARDPNSRRGRYNLPGTYFDRDKGDKDEAVPIENIN
jgi:hypothetical protein